MFRRLGFDNMLYIDKRAFVLQMLPEPGVLVKRGSTSKSEPSSFKTSNPTTVCPCPSNLDVTLAAAPT